MWKIDNKTDSHLLPVKGNVYQKIVKMSHFWTNKQDKLHPTQAITCLQGYFSEFRNRSVIGVLFIFTTSDLIRNEINSQVFAACCISVIQETQVNRS